MATIFSKIVSGEIPSYKIAEDESFYAFLDIMPLAPGHTLVVPKIEIDYIFDLNDVFLGGILPFARKIAFALEKAVPCERIGISVIGLEVPHAHVHLLPLRSMDDINFSKPKMPTDHIALQKMADLIISHLD